MQASVKETEDLQQLRKYPEKEHCRFGEAMSAHVCVPNASFLSEKDYKQYELWPRDRVEAVVPHCMNNIKPTPSQANIIREKRF